MKKATKATFLAAVVFALLATPVLPAFAIPAPSSTTASTSLVDAMGTGVINPAVTPSKLIVKPVTTPATQTPVVQTSSIPFATTSIPASGDEFVGPFPSWSNVKDFGAVGDGKTDDTAALQAAFDSIGVAGAKSIDVYLPAGTYLISNTLTMNGKININIIGADPATTIIKWAGATGGTMLQVNGTAYSTFDRMTFNGNKIAGNAVDESWDGKTGHFDTSNEYADDVFENVDTGLHGGFLGGGFAEVSILRDQFINNTIAGVSTGNFDALDVWVQDSSFQNCAYGVTNTYGAGNFKVNNSIFQNSTISDIGIGQTGNFSIRDNTSKGSKMFLNATFTGNPATIVVQGNTVLDTTQTTAVSVQDQGPVTLLDNTFRSLANATGAVINLSAYPTSNTISIGNKYTVTNPQSAQELLTYGNKVVSRSSLNKLTVPAFVGAQPNPNRQIFEVAAGATAPSIQDAINQAVAHNGSRPVVHLPYGTYSISSTITIPANSDVQLVGDGYGDANATKLTWTGAGTGPVIQINGPTKATIRNLTIAGSTSSTAIVTSTIDQVGARVFTNEFNSKSSQVGLLSNALNNTLVLGNDDGFSGAAKAVDVIGGSTPADGMTAILSAAESNNAISNEISNGGNLLVRDMWYEGGAGTYANLPNSGIFISDNNKVALAASTTVPSISLNNFNGAVTVIGGDLSNYIGVSGNGKYTQLLGLGMLTDQAAYIQNTAKPVVPGSDLEILASRSRGGHGSTDATAVGTEHNTFITNMLAEDRSIHSAPVTSLPDGVTDLRIYRVMTIGGAVGLQAGINNNS